MSSVANLGFGVGLRVEHLEELPATTRAIDWLEITPENWVGCGGLRARGIAACGERWPLVPHSVTMSIGGRDPFDETFFAQVSSLARRFRAPFWSDHVCYSVLGGTQFNDLYPLPFHDEALEHLLERTFEAQGRAGVPLVFENPTFYSAMPGATMDEATFLSTFFAESRCGMLLDVNNVYVNSVNHAFDPYAFVDRMPLERVEQIHLAGHFASHGALIDTHGPGIAPEVYALYRHTLRRAGRLIPTLIEWDSDIPALDTLVDELDRAREHARVALASSEAA